MTKRAGVDQDGCGTHPAPSWKKLSKTMSAPIPFEVMQDQNMKEFMTIRDSFSVILPDHLCGGSLMLKKGT